MTDDELDETVVASMHHIRVRVKPFMRHTRVHPVDAMSVCAVAWEIRKRFPELEPGWEHRTHPWEERRPRTSTMNLVALSLRRLHRIRRVERFPSGRRRDAPKYRAFHILEALAWAASE